MKQTTVDAYNDGRSREEILDLGSDANKDNLYITIVFEFAKATKERKLAYKSKLIEQRKFEKLPCTEYNELIVKGTAYTTYRLHKEKETDVYFQVEFETVPLAKEDMEVQPVFEKYKDIPLYKTEDDLKLTKSRSYGRDVYVLESKDDPDILISLKKSSETDVRVFIRYITEQNQPQLPDYKMVDDTITTSYAGKTVSVNFKNHLETTGVTQSFVINVYKIKEYYSEETIHTIFTDNNGAIKKVTISAPTTSTTFNLDEETDDTLYVNVVSLFSINARQFKMSYKPSKLPIIPKAKEKEYTEMTFSTVEKIHTYRLTKTNDSKLFVIEISKSSSILKENANLIQFAFEDETLTPKYTNDTTNFAAPKELQNSNGKEILMLTYSGTHQSILIHFFSEKPTTSNSLRLLDESAIKVTFKYKVLSQETDVKLYTDIPTVTSTIFLGTLTIKFTELFDSSNSEISSAFYTVSLFDKSQYTNETLNSIMEESSLKSEKVEGKKTKENLSAEFSASDIKTDVLVRVIATYTTTDGETGMIAYKAVEVSSNTYILIIIIVLAVLIVLAVGGFFIIKIMGKKRMKSELLSLGGGIGDKIDFKDDAKEINMVEQGANNNEL